jgi:hypothetical protein
MSGDRSSGRDWAVGGGVGVIVATGTAAFADLDLFDGSTINTVLGIFVLVVTVGGAIALSRFVARHGAEIGEARFDTRNKDDQER